MLPGVFKDGPFAENFTDLCKGSVCAVASLSGSSDSVQTSKAVAVGLLAMSSADFQSSGGKGVFVTVLHTARDRLTELCSPHQRAQFALTETTPFLDKVSGLLPLQLNLPTEIDKDEADDFPLSDSETTGTFNLPAGQVFPSRSSTLCLLIVRLLGLPSFYAAGNDQTELLMNCFLHGLSMLSAGDFPLPANVFYAKHMKNSKLDEFTAQPETVATCSPKKSNFCVEEYYFGPPVMEEVRIITSAVAPFFAAAGFGKGDAITQAEIHQLVSAYVDSRRLRNSDNKRPPVYSAIFSHLGTVTDLVNLTFLYLFATNSTIKLDKLLMNVCDPNLLTEAPTSTLAQPSFQITYQNLITSLTRGLKVVYRLTFPSESGLQSRLTTGNKRPKLSLLETKVNGKDVTRISNLATFGIDPKSFSRHLRTILACSVNVLDDTTHYNSAVQAQGAHVIRLSKLLTGERNLRPTLESVCFPALSVSTSKQINTDKNRTVNIVCDGSS
ncbi:unnamed protein product [Schistocephalus solidus]|uniref:SUI1 domain-containing protein n=1 Tax=Schistocephalus solidus TaxID=70667 RepID=A0A183TGW7_SCHSO|nr:unnamed protein product [Schistocephalus solidus]